MKHVWTSCLTVAIVAAVTAGVVHTQQPAGGQGAAAARDQGRGGPETNTTRTNKEELLRWMTELSNWGRWGKDDELGTVNLITPEKRKEAAKLVKSGIVVSLASNRRPGKIGRGGPGPAFIGPPPESSTMDIN